jgi:hypothetical protein
MLSTKPYRSTYNRTLLGWNPETHTTDEMKNIPRDLLSHDIIESSVMKTMLGTCTYTLYYIQ